MEANGTSNPVILANGDFPEHEIPLRILKHAEYLVCTDGSTQSLLDYQQKHQDFAEIQRIKPSAIVGDGDSLPLSLKERFCDIYVEYAEQDYNDLTKATRFLKEKGFSRITYLGVSGKRDDHALANYSLLMWYRKKLGIEAEAFTDYGHIISCCGKREFRVLKGVQVSVFNFGSSHLESTGLKWNTYPFDELWQGTLNEAVADTFTIDADGFYMVFISYDKKVSLK